MVFVYLMVQEATNVGGPKKKRIRHEAILGPAVDKDVAHEAVGLKAAALVPKEMPVVKKKNPIVQVIASQFSSPKVSFLFVVLC